MTVTTPNPQGKIALFLGIVFCVLTVVLTGYIFTLGPEASQDAQWLVLLVAFPAVIQLYLKRAVILSHFREHWYLWAVTTAVTMVVGLQLNYAQLSSSDSMAVQLRTYFFSWVEGQSANSEYAGDSTDSYNVKQVRYRVVSPSRGELDLTDPSNYLQNTVTWKPLPEDTYKARGPIAAIKRVLYHGLGERN
ncbi:hypothetical protein GCM10007094_30400 [Pseudovibrio japonicus]|uniref:Uncharacterized protein n=1 Tax=Pseudovibrio japonicus TaxID=366534 RepID=A0ABQ3EGR9_9HYPH|nr:hypothetical protein [Pseudovibrio japonicus]GHB38842.1 hypothetical protein GCM10007094_30400 [Pseudovibrio japonicus]